MVGASSRHYIQGETLHKNATGKPTVFKASYIPCALNAVPSQHRHVTDRAPRRGNEPVVFKQESQSVFDLSRRLADEFAGSRRLRLPIDFSPADRIVVYPYFRDTLLGLVRADPEFPRAELKKVLRHVGEAIREFHAKGWLHLGMTNPSLPWNFTNHRLPAPSLGRYKAGQHLRRLGPGPRRQQGRDRRGSGRLRHGLSAAAGRPAAPDGAPTGEFHVAEPRGTDGERRDQGV